MSFKTLIKSLIKKARTKGTGNTYYLDPVTHILICVKSEEKKK